MLRLCLLLLSSRTSRGLSLLFRTRLLLACLGIGALSRFLSFSLCLFSLPLCLPLLLFPRKLFSVHGFTSCTFLGSLCFLSAASSSLASSSGGRVATFRRDLATVLVSFSAWIGTRVFSFSLSLSLSLSLSSFSLSLYFCVWFRFMPGRSCPVT